MSREDGFPIADLDTSLMADVKAVALARRLNDPVQTAAHMALFVATILASWRAGRRVSLGEAAPAWFLVALEEVQANLVAVGLLDDDGRIPERSWEGWFRPAFERRERRRQAGRIGGERSGVQRSSDAVAKPKQSPSTAQATPQPSPSVAEPDRSVPTVPTGPPVPTGRPPHPNGAAGPSAPESRPAALGKGTNGARQPSGDPPGCPDPVNHQPAWVMVGEIMVCQTCRPLPAAARAVAPGPSAHRRGAPA